ncbi:hypothetical protein BLS_003121 [Venturia inaequalis]|uniref:protein-tyrosine-phosphatase n=1 Tax=Venturia inaequalis TaxID=5025 RepID=A0A8H3VT01_VENIN|nr:hypothetical protein BLS_003121 [Venturia inaequalis]KAE9984011.1 hypothetical protein EG328_009268 [Venturia inaequalis]KAE9993516.1 hypothetical protein EG327_004770 [Venturia inaequalis]RDI86173.1 3-ketoacyl-CoA thiolase, peroxisomal [Venturia inaequalis]
MEAYKSIHRVLPGLYLSGYGPAYNEAMVRERGITHIVKVARESTFSGGKTPTREFAIDGFMMIGVRDRSFERMYPYFHQIATFIGNAHAIGGVVLVHCQKGISRSVTAVIAHLMINHGLKLAEAYDLVVTVRNFIQPHNNFVVELRMLERELFGQNFEVSHLRISDSDQGESHALDWKYSLGQLHQGWEGQDDFTTEPISIYYDLNTGMYKLVRDKLREAARTKITWGEAVGHLREVIFAWLRTPYVHRGGRAMLFRILWRGLLQDNVMSRKQLTLMLTAIFNSIEWQYFRNTEASCAPQYAKELMRMVNTWDAVTLQTSEIQDFRSFVAFRKDTLHAIYSNWKWTDELHLVDAKPMEVLLYHCYRHCKEVERELGVDSGIEGTIEIYFREWEKAQLENTIGEAMAIVAALGVD